MSNKSITIPDQGLNSLFSEAYRSLRTNIKFSQLDKPVKTLLVTSSGPKEGKTTTVANLGISMAQAGDRVLLVDADLRLPTLHKILGVNNSSGLTSILKDAYDTDIIRGLPQGISIGDIFQLLNLQQKTGILKVITSGPVPPNPSELLGSKRMQALIKRLTGKFDILIFDSPPITSVADASSLASFLDGVVLVLQTGLMDRDVIQRAKQLLENANAKTLGVVLNQIDLNQDGYYYRYYSYYGYGDKGKPNR